MRTSPKGSHYARKRYAGAPPPRLVRVLQPPAKDSGSREISSFLKATETHVETIDCALTLADWNLYTGKSSRESLPHELERNRYLSSPSLVDFLRSAQSRVGPGLLVRRLQLLERMVVDSQIEQYPPIARVRNRLKARATAFRPRWKGRRVGRAIVREALRRSPLRAERKAAYYAEQTLYRPLERDLRRLIGARNDRARELGFRSYPEFKLSYEGLTVRRLTDWMEEISSIASSRFRTLRRRFEERTGLSDWYPWDLHFLRESETGLPDSPFPARSMVKDVIDGVRGWGFREPQLRLRIIRHDLPYGGIEIPVNPPHDVRVIVHPAAGWQSYMILFHEIGHGIHSRSVRVPTHLLRWHEYLPGFYGLIEGVGTLFEELPSSTEWLSSRKGLSPEKVRAFIASQKEADLIRMAQLIDGVRSELGLYLRPDANPHAERLRFLTRVFGYDEFRPLSFAGTMSVNAPVYEHSYILAKLFARQVFSTVLSEVGGAVWPNGEIGPWLTRSWFRDGALHDWVARMETVTGRPLSARAFLDSVSTA